MPGNLSNFGRSRECVELSIVLLALVAALAPAPAAAQPIDPALYARPALAARRAVPRRLVARRRGHTGRSGHLLLRRRGRRRLEDGGRGPDLVADLRPRRAGVGRGARDRAVEPEGDLRRHGPDPGALRRRARATGCTGPTTAAPPGAGSASTDSRAIGRILVDPKNPDVALVAALGHMFGPNRERGLFRTEDGGQTWSQVALRRREHGRRGSRGRSGEPRDRLRLAVAGPQLSLALLLQADGRSGERALQVDRRRPHLETSLRRRLAVGRHRPHRPRRVDGRAGLGARRRGGRVPAMPSKVAGLWRSDDARRDVDARQRDCRASRRAT